MIALRVKKLYGDSQIPTKQTDGAAGYDLYARAPAGCESIIINPHETIKIGTGIAIAVPEGNFAAIFARSGMALKYGLRPCNCVGVVDSDYRGEVLVALHNDSDSVRAVQSGDRIAQLIIIEDKASWIDVVEELPETKRGGGGFGSTGR